MAQAAHYNTETFALLMNKMIDRASKMRIVMNKLGISDTGGLSTGCGSPELYCVAESVKTVETHFIKLGKEHADLGESIEDEEELRLRGVFTLWFSKHLMTRLCFARSASQVLCEAGNQL